MKKKTLNDFRILSREILRNIKGGDESLEDSGRPCPQSGCHGHGCFVKFEWMRCACANYDTAEITLC
jgi:hypothetical protein